MPWFYLEGGQQRGPLSEEQFQQLVHDQVLRPDTLVWRHGMSDWQTLSAIHGASAPRCTSCGQIFSADSLIELAGATICGACKPAYLQRLREGAPAVAEVARQRYAGFWIRGVAALIDLLLLESVSITLHVTTGATLREYFSLDDSPWTTRDSILLAVEFIVDTGYETILVALYGGSLGKLVCGLRIRTADDHRLSFPRSLARALAQWVSLMPCGLGFVIAAFDSQKRALHDRICATRVIWIRP